MCQICPYIVAPFHLPLYVSRFLLVSGKLESEENRNGNVFLRFNMLRTIYNAKRSRFETNFQSKTRNNNLYIIIE